MSRTGRYLLLYLGIVAVVAWLFLRLPSAFLPSEDQGYFINSITLPVGATQQRTLEVLKQIEQYYFKQPEVADVIDVAGFSFNGQAQNSAIAFVHLKPWSQRPGASHSAQAVIGRAFAALGQIPGAIIYPLNPPPIPELGVASGFDVELEDQGGSWPRQANAGQEPTARPGRERPRDHANADAGPGGHAGTEGGRGPN